MKVYWKQQRMERSLFTSLSHSIQSGPLYGFNAGGWKLSFRTRSNQSDAREKELFIVSAVSLIIMPRCNNYPHRCRTSSESGKVSTVFDDWRWFLHTPYSGMLFFHIHPPVNIKHVFCTNLSVAYSQLISEHWLLNCSKKNRETLVSFKKVRCLSVKRLNPRLFRTVPSH
jgi:hypothetical protein